MQAYPIIVLVGPSGAGKTSLLLQMLSRFPNQTAAIKSKVTRSQRNAQDAVFYDFLSEPEFEHFRAEGRLFQTAHYAGHNYGCERKQTDAVVQQKIGLVVLVQQSVADFIAAGYKLVLVEIVPEGYIPRTENHRVAADQARNAVPLSYDYHITNSFAPGGFEHATDELTKIIRGLLNLTPTLR
jgi:ABC-type cobalamin/Fe3+-siderophores transport system ATPase subunit